MNTGEVRVRTMRIDGMRATNAEIVLRRGQHAGTIQVEGIREPKPGALGWMIAEALRASGKSLGNAGITARLEPASEWNQQLWDLPIALGALAITGQAKTPKEDLTVFGTIDHKGLVHSCRGAVSMAHLARMQSRSMLMPKANIGEARIAQATNMHGVRDINEACDWLNGDQQAEPTEDYRPTRSGIVDMREMTLRPAAKLAMLVAATGKHNILLIGKEDSGCTGLARRLAGLVGPMNPRVSLECAAIHSIAGIIEQQYRWTDSPPFRAPHSTASAAAIDGSGYRTIGRSQPHPGETALAHGGVLYLDNADHFLGSTAELAVHAQKLGRTPSTAPDDGGYRAAFLLVGHVQPNEDPRPGWADPGQHKEAVRHAVQRLRIAGAFDIAIEVAPVSAAAAAQAGEPEDNPWDTDELAARARRAQKRRKDRRARVRAEGRRESFELEADAAARLPDTESEAKENEWTRVLAVAETVHDLRTSRTTERISVADIETALWYRAPLSRGRYRLAAA